MKNDVVMQLKAVIDREKRALLTGNLHLLSEIYEEKQALMGVFPLLSDTSELRRVQAQITRNQDLLKHAMHGIQSVRQRLSDLRRAAEGTGTYDQNGKSVILHTEKASVVGKLA